MSQLTDWLNSELETRGWSYNELARRANLSKGAISVVMSERQGPGIDFCNGIARAFEMPPEEVFRRAGLFSKLPEEDETIKRISTRLRYLLSDRRGQTMLPYIEGIVDMFYKQTLANQVAEEKQPYGDEKK